MYTTIIIEMYFLLNILDEISIKQVPSFRTNSHKFIKIEVRKHTLKCHLHQAIWKL